MADGLWPCEALLRETDQAVEWMGLEDDLS